MKTIEISSESIDYHIISELKDWFEEVGAKITKVSDEK